MSKIKTIVITVLATLGVLFIILMLMPDDEEDGANNVEYTAEQQADADDEEESTVTDVQESDKETETEETSMQTDESTEPDANTDSDTADDEAGKPDESSGNTVTVKIPADEISDTVIKFKTLTLDNEKATQDIFGEYDLTAVHVWGTYCGPCISEMGDIGKLCKELPDNIGFVGIIVDVYDGIDRNADYAEEILKDADADFVNLRVSDDVYDVVRSIRSIPSTFFVDSEGHVVGGLIQGATVDRVKQRIEGYTE